MEPQKERPLFAQVGRKSEGANPASRVFNLFIALGILVAVGAFVAELATRPVALRFVTVDMTERPDPAAGAVEMAPATSGAGAGSNSSGPAVTTP